MDLEWMEQQLQTFVDSIDAYRDQNRRTPGSPPAPSEGVLIERAAAMERVVRAVRPDALWVLGRRGYVYTFDQVREACLEALGIIRMREELEQHLGPAGPQLAAARFHPWVWDVAGSLWANGHYRAAVQAASTSIDVHLQTKLDRRDPTGTQLFREAFSDGQPADGRPRLRLPGDRSNATWRSRQAGIRDFASGCFEAMRNPATHDLEELPEQDALEQLAALSLLARWVDLCEVDSVEPPERSNE